MARLDDLPSEVHTKIAYLLVHECTSHHRAEAQHGFDRKKSFVFNLSRVSDYWMEIILVAINQAEADITAEIRSKGELLNTTPNGTMPEFRKYLLARDRDHTRTRVWALRGAIKKNIMRQGRARLRSTGIEYFCDIWV